MEKAFGRIVQSVNVPCQLGGGLRNRRTILLRLFDWGINRAVVGTKAVKDPKLARERHLGGFLSRSSWESTPRTAK